MIERTAKGEKDWGEARTKGETHAHRARRSFRIGKLLERLELSNKTGADNYIKGIKRNQRREKMIKEYSIVDDNMEPVQLLDSILKELDGYKDNKWLPGRVEITKNRVKALYHKVARPDISLTTGGER